MPRCCFLDPLCQFWNLAHKSRWQDPPVYVWACLSTTHWSLHPSGARCGGIGDPWNCGLQKVLLARFWRKGRRRIRSAGMGERGWLCKGRSQVPCGFRREGGDGVGGADSALKPNPERSNAADPVQGNWVGLLGGSDPDWVAWRGMDTVVSNFLLLISPGKVGAVELRRCYWGWGGEARAAHMGQELWAVWLATCTPVPSLSLDFQPTHSTPKSSGSQGAPRGCRALEKQSPDFPQAPG